MIRTQRSSAWRWSWIACATAATLAVAPARAQGNTSDAIYRDIKDLTEELITAEVAESVAPNFACRAPQVLSTYPRSLQRVYDRQFGSLRSTLADETSSWIASRMLILLFNGYNNQERPGDPVEVAISEEVTPPSGTQDVCSPAALRDFTRPKNHAPTPLDTKLSDEERRTRAMSTCVKAAAACFKERKYANTGGIALVQTLNPGGATTFQNMDALCDDGGATPKTMLACSLSHAAQSILQGRPAAAESHVLLAVATILAEDMFETSRLDRNLIEQLAAIVSDSLANERGASTSVVADVEKLLNANQQKIWVAQDSSDVASGSVEDIARKAQVVGHRLSSLRRTWTLLHAQRGEMDLVSMLGVFTGGGAMLTEVCGLRKPLGVGRRETTACRMMRVAETSLQFSGAGELNEISRALQRRDAAQLAAQAIRIGFAMAAPSDDEIKAGYPGIKTFETYRAFAEAVAIYVLEAADKGEATTGSRAAFKQAAFDVIREAATGSSTGFDRSFSGRIIMPEFALRATYASSYINQAGGDGFRFGPSIDWITFRAPKPFRVYKEYAYVELQASIVDFLAPPTELALRKSVNYREESLVLAQFIHPRVEAVIGVPALSKRLGLSAGFSIRGSSPRALSDGSYRYETVFSKNSIGQFMELGLAIKYIP